MPNPELKKFLEANWYWYLTGDHLHGHSPTFYERSMPYYRLLTGVFPGRPRCLECNRPMSGLGSWLLRSVPATYSPRLCNICEQAIRAEEAGAEVELTMLFADVRGSSTLAEQISTAEFKAMIQRFYRVSVEVLIRHEALVNRLMGDQVIGLFAPRFAGARHAAAAVEAALDLLRATGHGAGLQPWVPLGLGIHSGRAYVGGVGGDAGVNEIAVLGSAANLAARLSSQAADGEIILSDTAAALAGSAAQSGEHRELALKGFKQPIQASVLRATGGAN
jgi:adenylate cyclase